MPTEMTVVIPVSLTDVNGEVKQIELKVWVVKADIPLLIGKDVHVALNMCTEPATETCRLGKEDDRRVFKLENTAGGHWGLVFNELSQIMFVDKATTRENFLQPGCEKTPGETPEECYLTMIEKE